MRRRQLVEIEDQAWCPRAVRDGGTDWLAFMANTTGMFNAIAPKIRAAMDAMGTSEVLDLCSGGGGPWLTLERALSATGPARVVLSDRYPNREALERARADSGGRLHVHDAPVDAGSVPADLKGVRTLFNAFHHFPPDAARRILADAVARRRAIVIVEGTNHRGAGVIAMPLQVPALALGTPFVRPFRWSRLLFTYVLPLIPLLVLFDGTVSLLRLYLEDELRELVGGVPGHETFDWDIGVTRIGPGPVGLLHLVGVPKRATL
ncbi:MAG TPA: class I SAM-dependent methyltransferase [Vicinamibacterales bacterium]